MDPSHWIAHKIPHGYSWTLISRLGQMLQIAEKRFGERDKSYTILGIEYSDSNPQTWYPGDCKHIAIQLGVAARADLNQALFHLSHECIHLLAPTKKRGVNVLEEGLASYFSVEYMLKEIGVSMQSSLESYRAAEQKVREVLDIDPNAIWKLRNRRPGFSDMDADFIMSNLEGISRSDAEYLATNFERGA